MTRPSSPECMAETARLAYHLHWPLDTILDLEHRDRRSFLAEADALAGVVAEDDWYRRHRRVGPTKADRWTRRPHTRRRGIARAAGARPCAWRPSPPPRRDRPPRQRGGLRARARARPASATRLTARARRAAAEPRPARRSRAAAAEPRRRRAPRPRSATRRSAWRTGRRPGSSAATPSRRSRCPRRPPATPREPRARAKLQRSRGARIVEGRAIRRAGADAAVRVGRPRAAAEPTLPPIPGADVPDDDARRRAQAHRPQPRRARPAPSRPRLADAAGATASIMRSAAARRRLPAPRGARRPAPTGERPAPVRMAAAPPGAGPAGPRRCARACSARPAAPRMRPAAPAPVADIVVAPPVRARVFRRAIDALTGRGPAAGRDQSGAPGPARRPGSRFLTPRSAARLPLGQRPALGRPGLPLP